MASEGFLERVKRLESEALSRSGKTQKQLEDELDGVMREYRSLQAVVGPIRTRFHNNEVPEGDARSLLSYLKRDTARLQEIKKRLEAANTALNQVRYPSGFSLLMNGLPLKRWHGDTTNRSALSPLRLLLPLRLVKAALPPAY